MSSRGGASPLSAYMLHRYDWSESSLIVDLFTRELGRVAVAAKGAKRPTSQLRSVLRPFQRLHATLGRTAQGAAHAEVHNLRSAEWAGGVPLAGGSALFSGFYLNELLMKLLAREDPHPDLWDAYADTLSHLGADQEANALRAEVSTRRQEDQARYERVIIAAAALRLFMRALSDRFGSRHRQRGQELRCTPGARRLLESVGDAQQRVARRDRHGAGHRV